VDMQLQTAIIADQAVIKDAETIDVDYVDEGGISISYEDLCDLYELKKPDLDKDLIKYAERILKEKETNSYGKLQKELLAA
jgi:hypothetical protein